MKRWSGRLFAAAAAYLCLSTASAQADPIVPFTYSWVQSPSTIAADDHGSGSITLAANSGSAVTPSTIVAASLSVLTSAPVATPDKFTNRAFSLTLNLRDTGSLQTASLVFAGLINGSASTGSSNFTSSWTTPIEQTVHLGQYLYKVDILAPVLPGITNGSSTGGISAQVTTTAFSTGPPTHQAPEPSALLLAGLGFPLAAAYRRWRHAV